MRRPARRPLFPYTTLFRSVPRDVGAHPGLGATINLAATGTGPELLGSDGLAEDTLTDRKSTRLNSRHTVNSYAVFCLPRTTSRRIISEAIEIHGRER